MGFLAGYFVTVNSTVYAEVFYGRVEMIETVTGVSSRGWLATFHFVFAALFLCGHIWHAIRARLGESGFDFKNGDLVQAPVMYQP